MVLKIVIKILCEKERRRSKGKAGNQSCLNFESVTASCNSKHPYCQFEDSFMGCLS